MNHIMIDLETMGNAHNAAIVAIGACEFDPMTGEIGRCFHERVSLEASVAAGLKMDVSTVLWWMQQSDAARSIFGCGGGTLSRVLEQFSVFCDSDAQVWGNGATFDITILESAYSAVGLRAPWKFWNVRDVRTVVELGRMLGLPYHKATPFDGIAHNALDDAKHQAKYVSQYIASM